MRHSWKNPPLITGDTHMHEGELKIVDDVVAGIRIETVECEKCGMTKTLSYDATVRSNL